MALAKAVVLAAERDLAGWPAFGLPARQLLPVANRPVLFHHLDALARAGVREAMIVTDAMTGPGIRAAVGDGSEWGLVVTHLDHADGISLLARADVTAFAGSAPLLVHDGDVLLREPLADLAEDFSAHELDALILRPGPDAPGTGYILGPQVSERLRGPETGLEAALSRLLVAGARIGVRQVDACMPCRGGMPELLDANRRMLEGLEPDVRAERVFETRIQGAVRIHPSAEISASVIRGPVVIGAGARIRSTFVGPYTSIGAGVELDCIEIEDSVVLDRARIRFIESRVEGSVVGPGACVSRDFEIPRALRLTIGADARVALA